MDVLEFIFSLLELSELISAVCEIVVWLFRAPFRLGRWMREPSGERWGVPYLPERKQLRYPAEDRGIFHLSLTRRRRGKWRGASFEVR
jgi:hypothetical protein